MRIDLQIMGPKQTVVLFLNINCALISSTFLIRTLVRKRKLNVDGQFFFSFVQTKCFFAISNFSHSKFFYSLLYYEDNLNKGYLPLTIKAAETSPPTLIAVRETSAKSSDGARHNDFHVALLNLDFENRRVSGGDWLKIATFNQEHPPDQTIICAGDSASSWAIFLMGHKRFTCYIFDTTANKIEQLYSGTYGGFSLTAQYWHGEIFIITFTVGT